MGKKNNNSEELKSNIILASKNEIEQLKNEIEELENEKSSGNNLKKMDIDTHDIVSFLIRGKEEKIACKVDNESIKNQLLETKKSLKEKEDKNIVLEKKQTELESELKNLKNNKERTDEKLAKTKKSLKEKEDENIVLEKKQTELELELKNLQSDKESVNKKLLESEKSLKERKKVNEDLEKEKEVLNTSLNEKKDELEEINEELKELKSFETSIKSPKLMALLNALLSNTALNQYRKKSAIVDDSAESIYNLLLKLSTGQIFIKSYYETLVEYKKENQEEMNGEEVAFYEAINSFFGEEVIKNPKEIKVEGKFDKSKHRGINNEKEGTLDNGIVLIPSDTTNNDKIKVKLKVKLKV